MFPLDDVIITRRIFVIRIAIPKKWLLNIICAQCDDLDKPAINTTIQNCTVLQHIVS